jgi:hypothetical protein
MNLRASVKTDARKFLTGPFLAPVGVVEIDHIGDVRPEIRSCELCFRDAVRTLNWLVLRLHADRESVTTRWCILDHVLLDTAGNVVAT